MEPFVKALNGRVELFQMLLLKAEYVGSVLAKYGLAGMPTHEIKWGTESILNMSGARTSLLFAAE